MTARARLLRPAASSSSTSTFGPTALASDWWLGESSSFTTSPGTTVKVGGDLGMGPEWYAYGMRWTSLTVPKDATISAATLTIRVTTTDSSAVAYSAHVVADDAAIPANQGAAVTQLDICTRTRWSTDIFGGSGGSSGALAIDVKAHVEAVTSRSGWSSGQAIVFYLGGGVIPDGSGGCIGNASGSDFVQVATDENGTSSYHPTLEIVYSS
jgi:hypothetical protein